MELYTSSDSFVTLI